MERNRRAAQRPRAGQPEPFLPLDEVDPAGVIKLGVQVVRQAGLRPEGAWLRLSVIYE
jgi:hypothetical protein